MNSFGSKREKFTFWATCLKNSPTWALPRRSPAVGTCDPAPYTPFHDPRVVVSLPTNVAADGCGGDEDVPPKNSALTTAFNQVLGDAVQRMILRNTTPEEAYQEIDTRYKEALAKNP